MLTRGYHPRQRIVCSPLYLKLVMERILDYNKVIIITRSILWFRYPSPGNKALW
jgi:hypothetical protein